jgi:hypothetical protein
MLQNPIYMGWLEYGRGSINSPQKDEVLGSYKTLYKVPRYASVDGAFPVSCRPACGRRFRICSSSGAGVTTDRRDYLLPLPLRAGDLQLLDHSHRLLDKAVLDILRQQLQFQMNEGYCSCRRRVAGIQKKQNKVRDNHLAGKIAGRVYTEVVAGLDA